MKSKVKELRKLNRISQDELANILNVTRQTIHSIENEKYVSSLVLAYKIARYFQLSIEEIFDFSEVDEDG